MSVIPTVQNDQGNVEDADSYTSIDYLTTYAAKGGIDVTAIIDPNTGVPADLGAALVRATTYLDTTFTFIGERALKEQTTAWPRYNAFDRDRFYIDGVPLAVKKATCEYAIIAAQQEISPNPTFDETGARVIQISETVGPISSSKTYASGAVAEMPSYPKADNMLRSAGLIAAGGRIIRG